ncbi:class I SAM-dependent RNA methyltransferase [Butyrivibrio sp. MC2013]|uniref:class I SAM-dependent RNA methyltransferase n=1 Tax=Butyrivibrio sp. MC2013 TaxID=1280686 RepID=UPI0004118D6E|nr:class I SAM-dependent RNA methyltransferase [Butyrivibrio sp. MC2013]
MKKKQIIEGTVDKRLFPNKGIVKDISIDGEGCPGARVTVKNTLPGQKVRAVVTKARGDRAEGRLLEVIEKAPGEEKSPCPYYGICGSCHYLTLSYDAEQELKEAQVRDLLRDVFKRQGDDVIWDGIKKSPERFEYRNKMEFSFGDEYKDGPLALGMHKRGSMHDIVSVPECCIVDEDYRTILEATLDYFAPMYMPMSEVVASGDSKERITFYHTMQQKGYLRHLLVRKARRTGQILVDLITTSQEEHDLTPFKDMLLKLELKGSISGILHTTNDSLSDAVIDQGTEVLYGSQFFEEELMGLKFTISPFSFFQTNSLSAEIIYDTVRDYIRIGMQNEKEGASLTDNGQTDEATDAAINLKAHILYDLYCGTGTISQLMSPVADKVIGVEIVEEAVEAAKVNAKRNKIDNCEFIAGDVLKVLDEIEEKPDVIILDPPRDGIHPKALKKILSYGVKHMVYVSCKPTSLARDLDIFLDAGYKVDRACAVNQFPGTVHVETVCLLSKLHEAKHHVNVKLDMDELELTSAEAKATYKEIEEWVQEHYGFHVTNLNIAQVKQKHGIIERENYNKPKSENSRQPGCPEEKVKAIEDAMRHFQMIK